MELTYDKIQPLILSELWEGNKVHLKFATIEGRPPLEATHVIMHDQATIQKNIQKRSMISMLINSGVSLAMGFVHRLFPGNSVTHAVTSTTSSVVNTVVTTKMVSSANNVKITPEMKQEAIVRAFRTVENWYKWDGNQLIYTK